MATQTKTPASLRALNLSRPSTSSNMSDSSRPYLVAGRKDRTALVGRTAFVALLKESEDARITGATRSLDRRLLALNLRGPQSVRLATVDVLIA